MRSRSVLFSILMKDSLCSINFFSFSFTCLNANSIFKKDDIFNLQTEQTNCGDFAFKMKFGENCMLIFLPRPLVVDVQIRAVENWTYKSRLWGICWDSTFLVFQEDERKSAIVSRELISYLILIPWKFIHCEALTGRVVE